MSNLDTKPIMKSINALISNTNSDHLHEVLSDVNVVMGYKQPKNLLKLLTRTKFGIDDSRINNNNCTPGIFANCTDKRCNLCKSYIKQCSSFETGNGVVWNIKSHINCNSKFVIYYLKCKMCHGKVTYTEITETKLRIRTNNHISSCRHGTGTNMFDLHVFNCDTKNNCLKPSYFEVYAFMKISTAEKLRTYERSPPQRL